VCPKAEGTLVALPRGVEDALPPSPLTLSDVMGTGHHATFADHPPGPPSRPNRTRKAFDRPGDPQEETLRASRPAFYNNVSVGGDRRHRWYDRGLRGMGLVGCLTVFLARMYALPRLIVSDE